MNVPMKAIQAGVLIFLITGYFLSVNFVSSQDSLHYTLLSLANIVGYSFLAVLLGKPKVAHAPIWLILYSILICYFLQFYIVLHNPRIAGFDLWIDDFVADPIVVMRYFEAVTLGFCSFCLASILTISFVSKKPLTSSIRVYPSSYFRALIAFIVLLSLLSGSIMAIFGTSQMGGEAVNLPFRLSGVVFFVRVTLIPSLIIYGILIADVNGRSRLFALFLVLLVIHGLSDMLMRSSRGFLLQIVLMATMLFVLSGRLNAFRVKVLGWTVGFTIITVPIMGISREIRGWGGEGIISGMVQAISEVGYDLDTFFGTMIDVSFFLLLRFTGAVSFLQIMGREPEFVLNKLFEPGFSIVDYMTYEVMEWPVDQAMGYAPSTFGYLYLLDGLGALALGMIILVVGSMAVWTLLCRLSLRVRPVVMAIFLSWYFVMLADGTWDGLFLNFFMVAVAMIFCECLARVKFGHGIGIRSEQKHGSKNSW